MALRLTPSSSGARSTGQKVGAGLFAGLEGLANVMSKRALADEASSRTTGRELLKDYTDKVMSGKLEPAQAVAAMQAQGMRIPANYFESLQPNVEQGLSAIVGGLTKASTPQEVEGETALASEPILKRIPFKTKFTPQAATDDTLPSTSIEQYSPEFERLLKVRDEKLNAFAPKEVASVDAEGTKQTQFVPSRPDQLTGRTFRTEASPLQEGLRKATSAIAEQRASNAAGLPQMKGAAFTAQEGAERGAKAATASAVEGATKQAQIGVETNPANVEREAARQARLTSATTTAREDAVRAGIPPDIANNYIHGTLAGNKYAEVPADVPSAERSVIIRGLATAGVRHVTRQEADALKNIDKARADYDDLMKRFEGHLSKDAAGRPLSSVTNKLGVYLQSDPQLAAAVATDFPLLIQTLKANAGTVGRIMQIEVERMAPVLPQADDTWRMALEKKLAVAQMFNNVEQSILGHPERAR